MEIQIRYTYMPTRMLVPNNKYIQTLNTVIEAKVVQILNEFCVGNYKLHYND